MILEIKSILKNKISWIILFILLVTNMVALPDYMGNTYDVEQNMSLFESQIETEQEIYSQIKMQYSAQRNISDEVRSYWENYLSYLDWSIQNAKDGWNLFNTYGNDVLTNKKLFAKYSQITLWDKLYHLDTLKKDGDKEFLKQLSYDEPEVPFDKHKIYVIGSQVSTNKKEDFREKSLSIQEQLHENQSSGKGVWAYLVNQLRMNSPFTFLCMPLCLIFCIVILLNEKNTKAMELSRFNNSHFTRDLYVNLFLSFSILVLISFFLPLILLTINNGLSGWNDWVLVDSKHLLTFSTYNHSQDYITNNLSEYYLTWSGFTPDLTYIEVWKTLGLSCILAILKMIFFTSLGVFCSFLSTRKWINYVSCVIFIVFNWISQTFGLFANSNPFSILSCFSVVSGCGYQSWFNGILALIVGTILMVVLNDWIIKRKDYS